MTSHRWSLGLAWFVVLAAVGCAAGATPTEPAVPSTASPTPATTEAPGSAGPALAPSVPVPVDGPPTAMLAAEGGDPVVGQLGSYTWAAGGSDSPWLPGAPIAFGSGEPLSVTVAPTTSIASWRARSAESAAGGPDGAVLIGEGAGAPAFAAPGAGSWTIEVRVVFADDVGDARYYWKVEVS